MATVSESISTLINNTQGAASTLLSVVLGEIYHIYNQDYLLDGLGEPPVVSTLDPATFTEPDELYVMLDTAYQSLHDVGNGIPALADILGTSSSVALDSYVTYIDKYRNLLISRLATLTPTGSYTVSFASQVYAEGTNVPTTLSPLLQTPAEGLTGFQTYVGTRMVENAGVERAKALLQESIMQSKVDVALNELAIQANLTMTTELLNFAGAALRGVNAIIRKTIVSPTDVVRIFDMLTAARTQVGLGIADNKAAYAGTQMAYINAVIGYYDVFADLEKVRIRSSVLDQTLDAEADMIKAVQLAGAASAAAAMAASGYAAARVGFVLSQKQFS